MSHSIKHLFHISEPRTKVYAAIHTVEGASQWWTVGAAGSSDSGGILEFSFGPHGIMKAKVEKLVQDELVVWKVLEGPDDWVGTTLNFALDENPGSETGAGFGKTRVRFEHAGWPHNGDHYAASCFSWARYMESLRQLCQTGRGEGHGTPGYRK